ncbi:MAG TPA: sigma-70 family RNA polymerase sigma factor [Bryobacteraceae bacterium]|nr:sigma-70 family RNA polymerase sigma factor [Bryobacteraceae bacterium]
MTAAVINEIERETALIRKIVGGELDLFGSLMAPHISPLSRTVRAIIGGRPEVEDIVQQTALKAFTHLAQFRFEARFRTWLIRIGLNEARQWRRKHTSSPFVEFTPTAEQRSSDPSRSPLIEYLRSETTAQLGEAFTHLPEQYRSVIVLRDVEGLSISEVAVQLSLSIPAVKSRHRRARLKVVEFLKRSRKFGCGAGLADDSSNLRTRSRPLRRTANRK